MSFSFKIVFLKQDWILFISVYVIKRLKKVSRFLQYMKLTCEETPICFLDLWEILHTFWGFSD